ncbi:MAG: rhodanese-like domain-containing protein [Gammaproteobacteria bacterium]|jgi:rhodanese-related sulfurtransferase
MFGFNELDAATLAEWMKTGEKLRLVDVRTPAETSRGVIAGAELLPLHLLPLKIQDLVGDGTKVVFYCQSGARSAQACAFFAQNGVGEAYNLRGGIMGWLGAGLPIGAPSEDALTASAR